jgi:hypothetical protein
VDELSWGKAFRGKDAMTSFGGFLHKDRHL